MLNAVAKTANRAYSRIRLTVGLSLILALAGMGLVGCSGVVSGSSSPTPSAPSITTQPASQTVTAGQTATFSVVATGTSPLSYQWKKDGTAISGAVSSSFTTPTTTSSDNGAQFTVVVSNAGGSATSNPATLTVNSTTPPSVPTGLSATAASSSQINLTWNASTGSVAGYNVYRAGTKIGTSTTTSYQDSGLSPSTSYTYAVSAFDAAGNTSAQSSSASATTLASGGGGIPNTLGWYQIPNTQLASVCPPASQFPNIGGSTGCTSLVGDWSGGAADTTRNRLIIWGGGHGNYFGNEVYALNLTANPITLTRLTDPTNLSAGYSGCSDAYPDGKPASRHTYDLLSYSPNTDTMVDFAGALSVCGSLGTHIFQLNLSTLAWTDSQNGAWNNNIAPWASAYDPNSGLIYFSDGPDLFRYNPSTNVLTNVGGISALRNTLALSSLVVDPGHKYLFLMGGSGGGNTGGNLYRWDISGNPPYNNPVDLLATATGCTTWLSTPSTNDAPVGPGVQWYPVRNVIALWNGGDSVGLYDPVTNSCSSVTFSGGPGPQQQTGTFGRFSYFPALRVFAVVNSATQNAYTIRIDSPPPTVSITSPVSGATVSATVIAAANADVGVTSVQFLLDGANLGTPMTTPPYTYTWDTTSTTNGSHTLSAQARDAAGNVGTSVPVSVTVSNSASSADQNFQQRCAAAGVLNCQGFDTATIFNTSASATTLTDGFNAPANNPNNIRDTSIYVSGGASAKFHIPNNAGLNCCNNYWGFFGQGANNVHFGQNSDFYVQFAFRADSTWTSKGWVSDSFPKLVIFHSIEGGSCANEEITTVNTSTLDTIQMYTDCGAQPLYTCSDGATYTGGGCGSGEIYGEQGWTDLSPFTGYQCGYTNGAWNTPNCFNFVANQWYTLYWHAHIGTWGTASSTVEAWVAPYGQQLKKWINVHNIPIAQDPGAPGFNVLELTQFMTAHAGSNPAADVWFDELIISSKPIPAPAGSTPP